MQRCQNRHLQFAPNENELVHFAGQNKQNSKFVQWRCKIESLQESNGLAETQDRPIGQGRIPSRVESCYGLDALFRETAFSQFPVSRHLHRRADTMVGSHIGFRRHRFSIRDS